MNAGTATLDWQGVVMEQSEQGLDAGQFRPVGTHHRRGIRGRAGFSKACGPLGVRIHIGPGQAHAPVPAEVRFRTYPISASESQGTAMMMSSRAMSAYQKG